jgi:hypothetical protein
MKLHRHDNSMPLSLRVIAEWEERVFQQRELIADLKLKDQPSKAAEAGLRQDQAFLDQLRNHWQTMQELLEPDPHASEKAMRRRQISNL